MKYFIRKLHDVRSAGFVLPLTLVICVIILTIATGISVILAKELYFSKLSRLSQVAYYAADNGLMCATMVDDQYIDPETGAGIFQYNTLVTPQEVLNKINATRSSQGLQAIALNDIKCATSAIFDATLTNFATSPYSRVNSSGETENGITSSFDMRMNLGDGNFRCATVSVSKTTMFRQIIARGYATCTGSTATQPIERAIVSNSESAGISTSTPPVQGGATSTVLTSGSSWTVPSGVTTMKVWAIGAGGGGAGSPGEDGTSGGGGGAGGVAYREYTVTPGDVVTYTIGTGGNGGSGAAHGYDGSDTTATVSGVTIRGRGGTAGKFNNGQSAQGGNATGGTPNRQGGDGAGAIGDTGGGGGGGIGTANGTGTTPAGGTGGQANDISGLFAVVTSHGYSSTGPGTGGGSGASQIDNMNGTPATGFGSGGGGAGYYGGNGGNGLMGGGGGGAAGYSMDGRRGGTGGSGAVIISAQ